MATAQSLAAVLSALQAAANSTSVPIVIPSSMLESAEYKITLSLTNWLGFSRLFGSVSRVSSSTDIPTVNILGASVRTIRVYDQLVLSAEGSVSGCSLSNTLSYTWQIYKNYVLRAIKSESKDPRKLIVKGYELKSGVTYQCKVTATTASGSSSSAVVDVYIEPGAIKVEVAGGSVRMAAIDKPLLLDASGSVDLNVDPIKQTITSDLTFAWSCTVTAVDNFGAQCNEIFGLNANLTKPFVRVTNMTLGSTYAVTVIGSSPDARTSSALVALSPLSSGAATVRIQSKIVKFNADNTLKLIGAVTALSNQTMSWLAHNSTNLSLTLN